MTKTAAAAPPPAVAAPAEAAVPADPTETVKAFLGSYMGEVAVTVNAGKVLPVAHEARPQDAYDCAWEAGEHSAGTGSVQIDKARGYVSLAILRWPQAEAQPMTDASLRSAAIDRLHQWVGDGVDEKDVAAQPLGDENRVAFVWDGRDGDHYTGQRAHVVLSRANGLPVSFAQYQPPADGAAAKLAEADAVTAATTALAPMPADYHQTGADARLYDHSPLAKDEGPVWAIAFTGTKGSDNQPVQAGAVIDAVSGAVLAPKPATAPKT